MLVLKDIPLPTEEFQKAAIANVDKMSATAGVACTDYVAFSRYRTSLYKIRVEKNQAEGAQ